MNIELTLQFVIDLADKGFWIFPIKVNDKTPAISGWPDRATRDRRQIVKWWSKNPRYNVGIYTGKFSTDKQLLVLDVDMKHGKNGFHSLLDLECDGKYIPSTYAVKTPNGGLHLYYISRTCIKNSVNKIGLGLDVRGEGGYVIGPGSVIPEGSYTWTFC